MLNIDKELEINKPIRDQLENAASKEKKYTGYAQKFLSALGAEHKEETVGEKKVEKKGDEPGYVYSLLTGDKLNPSQVDAEKYLEETRKRASKVTSMSKLFGFKEQDQSIKITVDNANTLLGMYVQNKLTAKNADRREYITKGSYINPFVNGAKLINFLHTSLVNEVKAKKLAEAVANVKSNKYSEAAKVFHDTDDLNEAAGSLMGTRIGEAIGYYAKALASPDTPLLAEKIAMLTSGKYKGVSLLTDRGGAMPWDMGKHYANGILRANHSQFDHFGWTKCLPMVHPSYITRVLDGKP